MKRPPAITEWAGLLSDEQIGFIKLSRGYPSSGVHRKVYFIRLGWTRAYDDDDDGE